MKVLASDFDGTLLFDEEFCSYDIEAIQEFQKKGNLFGLCSGRPLKGAIIASQGLLDFDFFIASSGALITDKDGNILFEQLISFETMKNVFERYSKDVRVCIQADGIFYCFDNRHRQSILPIVEKTISSLEELKDSHIYGLSLNAKTEDNAKRICHEINQLYDDVSAFQNKEYIDLVKVGCSKGTGILKLKEILNIDKISGIGDSYNDLPMLEAVDHAFTFHQSPKAIQEQADDVVDSVCEAIHILMEEADD